MVDGCGHIRFFAARRQPGSAEPPATAFRSRAGKGQRLGMASKAPVVSEARRIARTAQLELVAPECEKGIGVVVSKPDAAGLIEGVRIAPATLWPDDRGYFLEVQRFGRGLAADFPAATTQVSAAVNYPGTIKAFHYHLHQTDCWTPVAGLLQDR